MILLIPFLIIFGIIAILWYNDRWAMSRPNDIKIIPDSAAECLRVEKYYITPIESSRRYKDVMLYQEVCAQVIIAMQLGNCYKNFDDDYVIFVKNDYFDKLIWDPSSAWLHNGCSRIN